MSDDGKHLTAVDVMTAPEVAALLKMPTSTIHDLARRGIIPSARIGRRRRFVRQQVEAVLLRDGRHRD